MAFFDAAAAQIAQMMLATQRNTTANPPVSGSATIPIASRTNAPTTEA
ncbi:hypothetical protein [Ruegeria intermedia]|nr:hypothetical protein [Ruegeria intermedia]